MDDRCATIACALNPADWLVDSHEFADFRAQVKPVGSPKHMKSLLLLLLTATSFTAVEASTTLMQRIMKAADKNNHGKLTRPVLTALLLAQLIQSNPSPKNKLLLLTVDRRQDTLWE